MGMSSAGMWSDPAATVHEPRSHSAAVPSCAALERWCRPAAMQPQGLGSRVLGSHSAFVLSCAALEEVVPAPKPRSPTWLTSTFPEDSADADAQLCSAGYQARRTCSQALGSRGVGSRVRQNKKGEVPLSSVGKSGMIMPGFAAIAF